jgi:hypothetical protein
MTKEEILKSKTKSIYILESDGSHSKDTPGVQVVDEKIFTEHFKKYYFFESESPKKIGQFFLYEKLLSGIYQSNAKHDYELFYPKLGVYLNALPCDQTIEVEWVDYRRTWEWKLQYDYQYDGKTYQNYIGELPTEIERLALWGDSILVYGVWDSMPSWYQLKQAYRNTWWFHKDKLQIRDMNLKSILK